MKQTLILGNIVNDLELKQTQSGTDYVTFNVAVRRTFKNANGEYDTDFFPIVIYGATAKYVATYGAKGMKICVNGELRNRSYVNKDGQNVRVTEIVAESVELMSRPKVETTTPTYQNVQTRPAYPQTNGSYPQNYKTNYKGGVQLSDDDLDSTFGDSDLELPF